MMEKERLKRIFILLLIVILIIVAIFLMKHNIYKKGNLITQENKECINYSNKCFCLGTPKEVTECFDNECGPTQYECEGWEICWKIDEVVCN